MAPVVHSAPTAVQMPSLSAADKYKSYVRSNSNPNPQFDDNMKEPNNNNPDFKSPNINNDSIQNVQDTSPQFFTCYTSYSCTPTDGQASQSNQVSESSQIPVQAHPGKSLVGSVSNNDQLNKVENGKPGSNFQFDKVKNVQTLPQQIPQIKVMESSGYSNQMNQMNQLKNIECGKPAPHAQNNVVKNSQSIQSPLILKNNVTPHQSPPRRCPSPLILKNNVTPQQSPPRRKTSVQEEKPQGQYGLAQSRSSPAISSKDVSKSKNENLVLQYFQNPHTYKNLQENQQPGQGPVPKSLLPPPAPAAKSRSSSPRNSFTEKRGSIPNAAKPGDDKNKDWSNVLTKFYQW